jgi:hypothetical protein
MRNAAIGLLAALLLACLFRFAGVGGTYSALGSMVAFLFAAVFASLLLVGMVSRVGHTPRGAASIVVSGALLCVGVYWWLDLGRGFDGVEFETAAATAAEPLDGPDHAAPDLTQHQMLRGE